MDALLWALLIVVVIGAVWWFLSRKTPKETGGHNEVDHERPTTRHGLGDAVPQPPLIMNSTPEAAVLRPVDPDNPVDRGDPSAAGDPTHGADLSDAGTPADRNRADAAATEPGPDPTDTPSDTPPRNTGSPVQRDKD